MHNLDQRLRLMQWVCLGMAICSFVLGGWMMLEPNAFWSLVGAPSNGESGMAISTRVVYGGAILGEGVALLLVYLSPLHYLNFLHYMMAYKAASSLGLSWWLLATAPAALGGWLLIACWASAGLIATAIYPWGRHQEIAERLYKQLAANS